MFYNKGISTKDDDVPRAQRRARESEARGLYMRKILITILFFVLGLAMPLASLADFQKNKVAVLDFQLQGDGFETEDMGRIVAEWFVTALVRTGRFDVVERALLEKIISEHKLSLSGIVDEKTASDMGKLLGVKVIISGSVLKLHDVLEVNARIIDVETGSIIAAENVKSDASLGLQAMIPPMAQKIARNFPLQGYVVKRQEQTLTIDLGRMAGVQQGMKFIIFKEGEVVKHPRTGEILDVTQIQTGVLEITDVRDKIAEGMITQETTPDSVEYGQLVKSIMGPLQPMESSFSEGDQWQVNKLSPQEQDYVRKIRTGHPKEKIWVAQVIIKTRLANTVVLDAMAKELDNNYDKLPRDKHHLSVMIWYVRALGTGASRQRYRKVLQRVSSEAPNPKLKGYTQQILAKYI